MRAGQLVPFREQLALAAGKAFEDEGLVVGAEEPGRGQDGPELEEQRKGQLTEVFDAAGDPPVGEDDVVKPVHLRAVNQALLGQAG